MTDTQAKPEMCAEERAFQDALDADPSDWATRLVFADWLEDRGDPRAAGYRRLGELRKYPFQPNKPNRWWFWGGTWDGSNRLPIPWQAAYMAIVDPRGHKRGSLDDTHIPRQEAEDAAALAYRPEFEESPA